MSVRQDFIDAYVARWNCTPEYAEGLLQRVEAEHAHELAEKIRNTDDDRCNMTDCCGLHADDFADLIDPEVS